jgi:hypothetical protein
MKTENKKPVRPAKKNKAVLTAFILLFPSLLLALSTNTVERVLLFFYIAILIKNFVDDHYSTSS